MPATSSESTSAVRPRNSLAPVFRDKVGRVVVFVVVHPVGDCRVTVNASGWNGHFDVDLLESAARELLLLQLPPSLRSTVRSVFQRRLPDYQFAREAA